MTASNETGSDTEPDLEEIRARLHYLNTFGRGMYPLVMALYARHRAGEIERNHPWVNAKVIEIDPQRAELAASQLGNTEVLLGDVTCGRERALHEGHKAFQREAGGQVGQGRRARRGCRRGWRRRRR